MPGEPPALEVTVGTAGRVCGALATGGASGLLWIDEAGLPRETEPVTSCWEALLDENSLSLANRVESELQLTRLTAVAAVNARRDQESERTGSATQRMDTLTRLHS
jgi:hypothetical protein